jgi:hypothetical protein|tara:strand:- start:907 stop:1479 length:573 start_codon:yes stop_codon:yes gene_type:complete
MKKLLENWNKFLTEANETIQSRDNLVIFADWAKGHIERGHKEPGKGSIFADFDLSLINDAVSKIDINPNQAVYTVSVPNVGYDLVMPMEEAMKLPDANRVEVSKEERGGEVIVPGIETSKPLQGFLQDKLSVVIRPTTSLEYVPEDLKDQVAQAVEQGKAYSILSAWPGRGDVPPSSEWKGKWAVIIPRG